jgi:acyl dehydratase
MHPSQAVGPACGLSYDQLQVSQVFLSPARTVTEADIAAFAGLSGDFNPLHTDAVYAEGTAYRGRIAHGMLVQGVATGLGWQTGIFAGTIEALAEVTVRFRRPVLAGDTVQLRLSVLALDPCPSERRGSVRFGTELVNQRGQTVLEGEWLTVMSRRAPRRTILGAASEVGP